jgi:hypothetical protein
MVSGAFLGVAYFDLYFLLVGTSAVLWQLSANAEAAVAKAAPSPALAVGGRARLARRIRPVTDAGSR